MNMKYIDALSSTVSTILELAQARKAVFKQRIIVHVHLVVIDVRLENIQTHGLAVGNEMNFMALLGHLNTKFSCDHPEPPNVG